jgi:hypothetical protein
MLLGRNGRRGIKMAKVLNTTDRPLPVDRWVLYANSTKCIDRQGHIKEELPDNVAFGPGIKHLLSLGLVALEGNKVVVSDKVAATDSTDIQRLSKSQRKKLRGEQRS